MKNITVFTIVITALMSAHRRRQHQQERDRRLPDLDLRIRRTSTLSGAFGPCRADAEMKAAFSSSSRER